jgi:hypothetical protein
MCLEEVSGQRDEGIGRNPFPGVDTAQDQNAIDFITGSRPDAKDTDLAPFMTQIRRFE